MHEVSVGRNVTISISDRSGGKVFQPSLVLGTRQKNLTVCQYWVILSRPAQSKALLMTLGDAPQQDGGAQRTPTPNIVWHCPVVCGNSLTNTAIRNTSDTPAGKETPSVPDSGYNPVLPEYICMYWMLVFAAPRDGEGVFGDKGQRARRMHDAFVLLVACLFCGN